MQIAKCLFILQILVLTSSIFYSETKSTTNLNQYKNKLNYKLKFIKNNYYKDLKMNRKLILMGVNSFSKYALNTTPNNLYSFLHNHDKKVKIAADQIHNPSSKAKMKIDIKYLYTIDDSFKNIAALFEMGGKTCFLLYDTIHKNNKIFNSIYRINREKWFDFINGTKFDLLLDVGNNLIFGFALNNVTKIYHFKSDFSSVKWKGLETYELRQEIHKLSDGFLIFHNFRLIPEDYSIEVYNLKGEKKNEFFNFIPFDFYKYHKMPFLGQTICATNRENIIYIAFQFPQNPYRVWVYDSSGRKISVFGHHFLDPDEYSYPMEWYLSSFKNIEYYGIKKLCAIHKILVNNEGNVYVFWSKNTIAGSQSGKDRHQMYIDIFSKNGEYLSRTPFNHGYPMYIDRNDNIFSKTQKPSGTWKITITKLGYK